jgi:hypothetical protein
MPGMANAANETADASFTLTPRSGSLLTDGYVPANWSVATTVKTTAAEILPMKIADLQFPAGEMTFNPKSSMPVCPNSQIGPPPTNVSVPVPTAVSRCADSVIGNGTAKFVLGRNNLNPNAVLDGVMVVFNGGIQNGLPLIKVYAYSYDTTVGIYTEATLQPNGKLIFNIPQLTSDSSVSSLNLAIPSTETTLTGQGPGNETVVLPAGKDPDYVGAKCSTGAWPFSATFTLGRRDTNNNPIGQENIISDSGENTCTGVKGAAKIGSVRVTGPGKVNRGRPTVYKVAIKNTGTLNATGVRLRVGGRGIAANSNVGTIAAGKTRTVSVRAPFRSKGKIRVTFRVTSKNGGSKSFVRTVTVR